MMLIGLQLEGKAATMTLHCDTKSATLFPCDMDMVREWLSAFNSNCAPQLSTHSCALHGPSYKIICMGDSYQPQSHERSLRTSGMVCMRISSMQVNLNLRCPPHCVIIMDSGILSVRKPA